jgi:FlaA1/EpsC-like NDP-sugar epimerase
MDFLQRILSLPRAQKRMVSLFVDSSFLVLAFWVALFVRLDDIGVLSNSVFWMDILIVLPFSLIVFIKLGLYRAVHGVTSAGCHFSWGDHFNHFINISLFLY